MRRRGVPPADAVPPAADLSATVPAPPAAVPSDTIPAPPADPVATGHPWDADPDGDSRRARDPGIDPDANTQAMAISIAHETGTPVEQVREIVRSNRPPRRQPLLLQGLWPAAVAGGLVAVSTFGVWPFAVGLLVVQVFLVLGVLALVDAPASGGAFLVVTGATLAADGVLLIGDGGIGGLAGVTGLALVASLAHQLFRSKRNRVTESLADTLVVVVLAAATACLLALYRLDGGEETVAVALAAAAAGLLGARIGDRVADQPVLAIGSTRGWPGLLLGLGSGVAAAVVVAVNGQGLDGTQGALLGLVCAATVAAADLAVDLGAAELRAGWRDARRVAALRPCGMLLPFAGLGPVALIAGQLVLA